MRKAYDCNSLQAKIEPHERPSHDFQKAESGKRNDEIIMSLLEASQKLEETKISPPCDSVG